MSGQSVGRIERTRTLIRCAAQETGAFSKRNNRLSTQRRNEHGKRNNPSLSVAQRITGQKRNTPPHRRRDRQRRQERDRRSPPQPQTSASQQVFNKGKRPRPRANRPHRVRTPKAQGNVTNKATKQHHHMLRNTPNQRYVTCYRKSRVSL